MTDQQYETPAANMPRVSPVIVICATLIVVCLIAASVSIYLGVSDEGKAATMVVQLGAVIAPLVTGILALAGIVRVGQTVADVKRDTTKVLNGVMDAKIQRNVAAVLDERLGTLSPQQQAEQPSDATRVAEREPGHPPADL